MSVAQTSHPPYVVTDEQKDGDLCHTCNQPLEQAIIAHDPITGKTFGWICPTCRSNHFNIQRQFAELAHVGL